MFRCLVLNSVTLVRAHFVSLAIMANPQVPEVNWHALGVEGPCKLIRWAKKNDSLYSIPVYWGLRAIWKAYLDHLVTKQYARRVVLIVMVATTQQSLA